VVFDGNAIVWAEEPSSLATLWKQRMRWARGNLQLTVSFRSLWFNRRQHQKLGSIAFGLIWLSAVFMPLFMICGTAGLIGLYFLYPHLALSSFSFFWAIQTGIFLFETLFSFVIDPATARRAWFEGLLFPGAISLCIMFLFFLPHELRAFLDPLTKPLGASRQTPLALLIYAWGGLSMLAAWGIYRLEKIGLPNWIRNGLLLLIGYGPLLGAIAFTAIVAHCRRLEIRWDKTVKAGKGRILS